MRQLANESVSAYHDRFVAAAERTFSGGVVKNWKESLTLYQFIFASGFLPSSREAIISDSDFRKVVKLQDVVDIATKVSATDKRRTAFSNAAFLDGGRGQQAPHTGNAAPPKDKINKSRNQNKKNGNLNPDRNSDNKTLATPPSTATPSTSTTAETTTDSTCSRCGRAHGGKCRAEFDLKGTRIPGGKPPGQPQGWSSSYKGCNVCGDTSHLPRACKSAAADLDAPAVRAIHARIQQLQVNSGGQQQASTTNASSESPTKKRRRDDTSSEERHVTFEQSSFVSPHHLDYGCSTCGDGGHYTRDCEQ